MLVARRQEQACAVIFADVDGLKLINDQLGHAAGDELIREAVHIFDSAFRHADVVGRVGGDEFAAFTFDNATPRVIVERIEAKIAEFNAGSKRGAYDVAEHRRDQLRYPERGNTPGIPGASG